MPNKGFYERLSKAKRQPRQLFVSFHYQKKDGKESFGNTCSFKTNSAEKVTATDIKKIEEQIKQENDFSNVVIINYQIM